MRNSQWPISLTIGVSGWERLRRGAKQHSYLHMRQKQDITKDGWRQLYCGRQWTITVGVRSRLCAVVICNPNRCNGVSRPVLEEDSWQADSHPLTSDLYKYVSYARLTEGVGQYWTVLSVLDCTVPQILTRPNLHRPHNVIQRSVPEILLCRLQSITQTINV